MPIIAIISADDNFLNFTRKLVWFKKNTKQNTMQISIKISILHIWSFNLIKNWLEFVYKLKWSQKLDLELW